MAHKKIAVFIGTIFPLTTEVSYQILRAFNEMDEVLIGITDNHWKDMESKFHATNMYNVCLTVKQKFNPLDNTHFNVFPVKTESLMDNVIYRIKENQNLGPEDTGEYHIYTFMNDVELKLPSHWTSYPITHTVLPLFVDYNRLYESPIGYFDRIDRSFRQYVHDNICVTSLDNHANAHFLHMLSMVTNLPYVQNMAYNHSPYGYLENQLGSADVKYTKDCLDIYLDLIYSIDILLNSFDSHKVVYWLDPLMEYCKLLAFVEKSPEYTDLTVDILESEYLPRIKEMVQQLNYKNVFILSAPDKSAEVEGNKPEAMSVYLHYKQMSKEIYGFEPVVLPENTIAALDTIKSYLES